MDHQLLHRPAPVIARDVGVQVQPHALDPVVVGAVRRQEVELQMSTNTSSLIPAFRVLGLGYNSYFDERPVIESQNDITFYWKPSRLVRDVSPEEITRLKREGDLQIAGADLAQSFMRLDLVDQYQLLVNPIILGHGVPLFKGVTDRIDLQLSDMHRLGSGVVVLTYNR